MVSGEISKSGLGNIIFHSGNANIFSYKQVLDYYKADCNNFKPKFFQQDGARVYSSKGSQKKIQELFGDDYIPTWENGPKLNGEIIPKWPPNFPDLSPMDIIWSIINGILTVFPPTNIEELKTVIKNIWVSIPVTICQNIIDNMKERWKLCLMHKGRRLDKELLRKIRPNRKYANWTVKKSSIAGIGLVIMTSL